MPPKNIWQTKRRRSKRKKAAATSSSSSNLEEEVLSFEMTVHQASNALLPARAPGLSPELPSAPSKPIKQEPVDEGDCPLVFPAADIDKDTDQLFHAFRTGSQDSTSDVAEWDSDTSTIPEPMDLDEGTATYFHDGDSASPLLNLRDSADEMAINRQSETAGTFVSSIRVVSDMPLVDSTLQNPTAPTFRIKIEQPDDYPEPFHPISVDEISSSSQKRCAEMQSPVAPWKKIRSEVESATSSNFEDCSQEELAKVGADGNSNSSIEATGSQKFEGKKSMSELLEAAIELIRSLKSEPVSQTSPGEETRNESGEAEEIFLKCLDHINRRNTFDDGLVSDTHKEMSPNLQVTEADKNGNSSSMEATGNREWDQIETVLRNLKSEPVSSTSHEEVTNEATERGTQSSPQNISANETMSSNIRIKEEPVEDYEEMHASQKRLFETTLPSLEAPVKKIKSEVESTTCSSAFLNPSIEAAGAKESAEKNLLLSQKDWVKIEAALKILSSTSPVEETKTESGLPASESGPVSKPPEDFWVVSRPYVAARKETFSTELLNYFDLNTKIDKNDAAEALRLIAGYVEKFGPLNDVSSTLDPRFANADDSSSSGFHNLQNQAEPSEERGLQRRDSSSSQPDGQPVIINDIDIEKESSGLPNDVSPTFLGPRFANADDSSSSGFHNLQNQTEPSEKRGLQRRDSSSSHPDGQPVINKEIMSGNTTKKQNQTKPSKERGLQRRDLSSSQPDGHPVIIKEIMSGNTTKKQNQTEPSKERGLQRRDLSSSQPDDQPVIIKEIMSGNTTKKQNQTEPSKERGLQPRDSSSSQLDDVIIIGDEMSGNAKPDAVEMSNNAKPDAVEISGNAKPDAVKGKEISGYMTKSRRTPVVFRFLDRKDQKSKYTALTR